jgi:F0F1-type ATP synthase assembly protein I
MIGFILGFCAGVAIVVLMNYVGDWLLERLFK